MPTTGPEVLRDHWESTPQNRELLGTLQTDVLATVNYGSNVPLSQRQAQVQEHEGRAYNFTDIQQSIKEGKWGDALKNTFRWIFGKRTTEGLGLYVNSVNGVPLRERAGVIGQLEHHLDEEKNFDDDLRRSTLRFETDASLLRQGYVRDRMAARSTSKPVTGPGTTLQSYVSAEVWSQIAGDQPQVLGALSTTAVLPHPGYVYLDRDGFPLLVSRTLIPPGRFPPVPLYKKSAPALPESATREEVGINLLKRNLRRGDILLVSQGGSRQSSIQSMFQSLQQAITSRSGRGFHASHAMVYDGTNIRHINMAGKQNDSVEETFRKHPYNAVTVARISNSSKIEQFSKNMEELSNRELSFNSSGLVGRGISLVREQLSGALGTTQPTPSTLTDRSCICTDYVTKAAEGLLPDLANAKSPRGIAESADVRLVYSMDLGRA